MAAAEPPGAERLRLMCSHGGRFLPCGPDGAIRYVGGETRVIVVPRDVPFRELAAKLEELAGGKTVSAARYRLADEDGVLVSVTCDEELAHMRDEYDRLRATRPSASFRVFFSGVDAQPRPSALSGRPPLAPRMKRVHSDQALDARARVHFGAAPVPMRRVRSAHEFAGCSRFEPCCFDYDRRHQCYCRYQSIHDQARAGADDVPTALPVQEGARRKVEPVMPRAQDPAPEVSLAKATGRVVSGVATEAVMKRSNSDREAEESNRTAIREFV